MPNIKTIVMALWIAISSVFNFLDVVSSLHENLSQMDFMQVEVEARDTAQLKIAELDGPEPKY